MLDTKEATEQSQGRLKGIKEATIWQKFTFGWMTNLIWHYGRHGNRISLDILPDIVKKDDSGEISHNLQIAWDKEVSSGGRSLWRVLYQVLGRDFVITGTIGFSWSIFKILQAGALGFFIKYLRTPEKSLGEGVAYAAALSIFNLFAAIAEHHYFFPATRIGYRARVGLIALLFRKALNVSSSSMVSTGEAVNLISNDVQPFESGMHFLNHIWLGPLELVMSVAFLWFNIGISSLVAVGVYLLMIPLQSYISAFFKRIRGNTVKFRDNRIKLLSDILCGIEIVKLNAWEKPLVSRVTDLRKLEYDSLKRANMLKGLNQALFTSSSQIVHFFTFTTLWMLVVYGFGRNIGGKGLFQPENIFPCVSIFASMRHTMTLFLPKAFEYFGEMRVSIKRIEEFLLLPNYKSLSSPSSSGSKNPDIPHSGLGEHGKAIIFANASLSWKADAEHRTNTNKPKSYKKAQNNAAVGNLKSNTLGLSSDSSRELQEIDELVQSSIIESEIKILDSINMVVEQRQLCSIVGPVGSGKSSMCHAILGEMNLLSGDIKVNLLKNQPDTFNKDKVPEFSTSDSPKQTSETQYAPVAYASQSAWIFCGTIQENILFGNPYEKDWFEQVVYACSLDKDFELFEEGKDTIIGERGVNLSGGQRARISLARAVYTRADLYVLDDPLSAVDPKVGNHLFENVICGLLKDKTRVLVTHQLQFVSKSNLVILLEKGKVVESGPPATISKLEEYTNTSTACDADSGKYPLIDDLGSESEISSPISLETFHTASDSSQGNACGVFSRHQPLFSNHEKLHLNDLTRATDLRIDNACKVEKCDNRGQKLKQKKNYLFSTLSRIKRGKVSKRKRKQKNVDSTAGSHRIGSKEESRESHTSLSTYLKFFRFGASYTYMAMCLLLAIGMLSLNMSADYFLSKWSVEPFNLKRQPSNVLKYFLLIFSGTILSIVSSVLLYRLVLSSSNALLHKMLHSVVYAPMNFFESQPLGRILNRFSKDQSNIDESLATTAVDTVVTFFQTLGALVFICMANAYLLILVPVVIAIFIWLRQLYMKTSRQVKQIESVTRSPVYSLLSETLDGLITVRAFSSQNSFIKRFISAQRENSIAFFAFIGAARWLAFRLDILNSAFITVSAFSMLAVRKTISPSLVALSMSYILSLVGLVQWCVRQSIEVEITFVSVERNLAYSKLVPEEPPEGDDVGISPPKSWPDSGAVAIRDLNVKYNSSIKPVLQNINMDIQPGEKVGIVGRTGAGKSSFVSSIFRLVEPYPNGCINIDQVNISDLRLNKLRSSISMIPQQPFLFEGSLRFNLDPWGEYSDEEIWAALDAASLKAKVEDMPAKLESEVVENGKNFSVGERQLISLCRAILHKKKLVVMDEATANVDLETDKQIQKSIHTHFEHSTVITIAHRLHTIIGAGYDKIAVFDHGKLLEFGHPHELLKNENSILSKMVADTGSNVEANLRMLASREWNQKQK